METATRTSSPIGRMRRQTVSWPWPWATTGSSQCWRARSGTRSGLKTPVSPPIRNGFETGTSSMRWWARSWRHQGRAEWVETFDRIGVPSGPINRVSEALSSPQTLAREMVMQSEHSVVRGGQHSGLAHRDVGNTLLGPSRATDAGGGHRCGAGGAGLFGRGDLRVAGGRGGLSGGFVRLDRNFSDWATKVWILSWGSCRVANVCSMLRFCLLVQIFSIRIPIDESGCRLIWRRSLRVCCWR